MKRITAWWRSTYDNSISPAKIRLHPVLEAKSQMASGNKVYMYKDKVNIVGIIASKYEDFMGGEVRTYWHFIP